MSEGGAARAAGLTGDERQEEDCGERAGELQRPRRLPVARVEDRRALGRVDEPHRRPHLAAPVKRAARAGDQQERDEAQPGDAAAEGGRQRVGERRGDGGQAEEDDRGHRKAALAEQLRNAHGFPSRHRTIRRMWWHDFFDADALWLFGPTLDPERTEREVAGVVRMLRLKEGQRVLDLGCGHGRHAVALARRGLSVVGAEWSPAALQAAQAKARALEVSAGLVRADLRRLPLRSGSCEAAMSLFSTLGYEDDRETAAFLAEARRVLKPGGRLVVEVLGRDRVVRDFAANREWYEVEGRPVRVVRWLDLVASEERAVFHYDRGEGPREKPFRRRLFTAAELATLLAQAGFARVEFAGDYEGGALTLEAPTLIAVARAGAA